MKSGYRILWTDHALSELQKIIEYLEDNWTERELKTFAHTLDHCLYLTPYKISKRKKYKLL